MRHDVTTTIIWPDCQFMLANHMVQSGSQLFETVGSILTK